MIQTASQLTIRCARCAAEKRCALTPAGRPRLQSQWGWKRVGDGYECRNCWLANHRLTSIVLPIRPVEPKDWPELRQQLQALWRETTSLANWAIHQLAVADTQPVEGDQKLAKLSLPYLYGLAAEKYPRWPFWGGQKQAANIILRMAERRYRKDRLNVLWHRKQALATFRHGVPYPLDADAYAVERGAGGEFLFSCYLAGQKRTFVLATHNRGRFKGILKQLASGQAQAVESQIYERRASPGDHRAMGDSSDGARYKRLYAKIVCWIPKTATAIDLLITDRVLHVRTAKEAFWVALVDGTETPWTLNADHVKRWITEYMVRLGRLSEDTKYEKRWPKRQRRQIAQYRETLVAKQKRRIDTWLHQATALLVAYACRQRVGKVRYCEEDGCCVNPFPWYHLRTLLQQKCEAQALEFEYVASATVPQGEPEHAREE